jgi:DNA-binding NarL/FixJ family response regulator
MKILVIDQSDLVSPALAQTHFDIVWAEDEVQAYHAVSHLQPAVIFLAYSVLKSETPSFVALLARICPQAKVVITDERLDDDALIQCLAAGAQGYQERDGLARYAQRLVFAVTSGEAWLTRRLVSKLLMIIRTQAPVIAEFSFDSATSSV